MHYFQYANVYYSGTSWYDQALSETVLESLDFNYEGSNKKLEDGKQVDEHVTSTKWKCIMGSAQQLAINMEKNLKQKPTYESRMTAIRALDLNKMEVDFQDANGKKHTNKDYEGVFDSTTSGCLKQMDTHLAGLNYTTKQAIRSLRYGPSAKVGMKFKKAWWIHNLPEKYKIKEGGLGHSDSTLRTCVYPFYNLYDPKEEPAVLLCSYTWQQDA